jgi:hypothetical protein
MHQYIETVRSEIERAAAQESYLASTLFLRMYKEFEYEDEGAWKITDKAGYEKVQNKAVNSISKKKGFDVKEEILAWQIAMLRDVAKESYGWWVDYKDEKFRAPDHFSDGESCIALESTCEKLGENPTEAYTALLEVEFVLTRLCTACNKSVIELDKYWQFKYHNKKKAPKNSFIYKRIEAESKQIIISKSIETLEDVSKSCARYAKQLAGSDHLLWMNPHYFLESVIHILKGFLHFEYIEDTDLSLSKWLSDLFPKRLETGQPNPNFQSGLHQKIIANLTQATQCMVQQTVKKKDVFSQRDEVLCPYIYEALERVKRVELNNLGSHKETEQLEQQQY